MMDKLGGKVEVGGKKVSYLTIGLFVAVILFSTGKTWVVGLVSETGFNLVLVSAFLVMAYDNRKETVFSIFSMLLSGFVFYTAISYVALTFYPNEVQSVDKSNWTPIVAELDSNAEAVERDLRNGFNGISGGINGSSYNGGGSGVILSNPAPVVVADQPVQTAVTPVEGFDSNVGGGSPSSAAIVPSAIANGDPAIVVGQGAGYVLANPTPDPTEALGIRLNSAINKMELGTVERLTLEILTLDPDNVTANNAAEMTAEIRGIEIERNNMPTEESFRKGNGEDAYVEAALMGGDYEIVKDGNLGLSFACQEISIIKEVSGWLVGNEYSVKRCLLDQFDADRTGDRFSVR